MAKILILANNDIGLYKFRKELIQDLISSGNQIFISLPSGEKVQSLIDMGCKFYDTDVDRRGLNPINDIKLLIRYLKIISVTKPDLVITYTVKPNIYGGIISRILSVSYAINITGLGTSFQNDGLLKKLIVNLYKIACKKAKVVFFENQENQRIFINNQIVSEEITCKLDGAGVNLEEYKFSEYPEDKGIIRFLFIGRVMKEKGVDELFEVATRIKKKYKNIVFDIVGPLEEDYKNTISELQRHNIINYYGYQSDVKPFVENTNCFILPSYHEGMANTLLECASMGRPLIASNIPGCKEAVLDGESGYLINVKDSKDLYSKVIDFINLPNATKKNMGEASRNYIEEIFSKEKVVKMTINRLFDTKFQK